jgi:hypothetical protein
MIAILRDFLRCYDFNFAQFLRCYDRNFAQFLIIFGEKNDRFLKKQGNDQIYAKTGSGLSRKNRQYF